MYTDFNQMLLHSFLTNTNVPIFKRIKINNFCTLFFFQMRYKGIGSYSLIYTRRIFRTNIENIRPYCRWIFQILNIFYWSVFMCFSCFFASSSSRVIDVKQACRSWCYISDNIVGEKVFFTYFHLKRRNYRILTFFLCFKKIFPESLLNLLYPHSNFCQTDQTNCMITWHISPQYIKYVYLWWCLPAFITTLMLILKNVHVMSMNFNHYIWIGTQIGTNILTMCS